MLSDSAAGTAPGLKMDEKKLVAALQRYATALDKVKALANDPELTEALRIDAESARFIAQLWKTSGLPDYKGWTEYRIAPRSRVPGRCLPEWLPKYEGLQKIWLASLAGG